MNILNKATVQQATLQPFRGVSVYVYLVNLPNMSRNIIRANTNHKTVDATITQPVRHAPNPVCRFWRVAPATHELVLEDLAVRHWPTLVLQNDERLGIRYGPSRFEYVTYP